jgi:MFS family permease
MTTRPPVRLGIRENLAQFSLLVVVNAFVGAMVGLERSILPAIAEREFHLAARAAILSFIVVFGVVKAVTNYFAGRFSDVVGRRRILIIGWLVATPVPFLLMWAPSWGWVVFTSVLLGVNQGLTWSLTVIMKIDLAGPERRGLATGLNEFAGYAAVALSAWVSGLLAARYGLRPEPLFLGLAVAGLGLGLSLLVRDTAGHVRVEVEAAFIRLLSDEKRKIGEHEVHVPAFAEHVLRGTERAKTGRRVVLGRLGGTKFEDGRPDIVLVGRFTVVEGK